MASIRRETGVGTGAAPSAGRARNSRAASRNISLMNVAMTQDFHPGTSGVKLNSKGGILMTKEEVQEAFSFLDVEKAGKITMANLKKRLLTFFPDLPAKELQFLMNNRRELTVDDLYALLSDNEIRNFDPQAEAFKVYDPTGSGALDGDKLRKVFKTFGMGELTTAELEMLTKTADIDGDGIVSLQDFRQLVSSTKAHPSRQQQTNREGSSIAPESSVDSLTSKPTVGSNHNQLADGR